MTPFSRGPLLERLKSDTLGTSKFYAFLKHFGNFDPVFNVLTIPWALYASKKKHREQTFYSVNALYMHQKCAKTWTKIWAFKSMVVLI